jgi:DNA (cytosine-5)-methyltransferase 1
MKILNLYSGLGGNRKLWPDSVQVTAVEYDERIAQFYQNQFPHDTVIIGDAIEYIEKHYQDFDFIWASPPCQSHSQYRHRVGVLAKGFKPIPIDPSLYYIIRFLMNNFRGLWAVENVIPYYPYEIEPTIILQRHPIWSNFPIEYREFPKDSIRSKNKISDYKEFFDIADTRIMNKRQALRNCVNPELGLHLLKCAIAHRGNDGTDS